MNSMLAKDERKALLTAMQRRMAHMPPLLPLTVDEQDSIVTVLKGERKGSALFWEALNQAPPRVIIRAAKECVLSPATTVVNRDRFAFLMDHLVKVLTQTPKMELNGEGAK